MAFGIVGLPIPDETILTFSGFLVYRNQLDLIPALFSALLGSITGISLSYILGRTLGLKTLNKFSKFFHITDKKIDKAKKWFERYGNWVLVFGYFIPGVRHVTALTAGSIKIKYFNFAVYTYFGALIWSLTFILIGYFAGDKWLIIIEQIQNHTIVISIIVLLSIIVFFIIRKRLRKDQLLS